VAAAAQTSGPQARRLLARARGDVKTAIAMGRSGARHTAAREALSRAGGDLRAALEALVRKAPRRRA
jgi:N-acetylmuramic acid 6-phosphate (MurNAc-6-P) etherase